MITSDSNERTILSAGDFLRQYMDASETAPFSNEEIEQRPHNIRIACKKVMSVLDQELTSNPDICLFRVAG